MSLTRIQESNIFTIWWHNTDRVTIFLLLILISTGVILALAASPPVAERIGVESEHFIFKQILFLFCSVLGIIFLSFLDKSLARQLALLMFAACLVLLFYINFWGVEIKGAKRWINLPGFTLQPSEFLKPSFAVFVAWILSKSINKIEKWQYITVLSFYMLIMVLLLSQPDFGMASTITAVTFVQLFLAGIPWWSVIICAFASFGIVLIAYYNLPHVTHRIDNFLFQGLEGNYQLSKSIEALKNGGIFGQGPSNGTVKNYIPDSHTDFIFAVIGEEFGLIACLILLIIFALILFRFCSAIWYQNNFFIFLAVAGIITQFGLQSLFNIGVTIGILPTKGMTLPFISYGGSSALAMAFAIGIALSFTKKHNHQ